MKTVFIDLDGTLLGMNQDEFINAYFGRLNKKFNTIENSVFLKGILSGIDAMVKSDGKMVNEDTFWQTFLDVTGFSKEILEKTFIDFYEHEFDQCSITTKRKDAALTLVKKLKQKGYRLICATNPLFPKIATYKRLSWANINPELFEEVTTFENYHYCKPNLNYYLEIMHKFQISPQEVIMIGNDVKEDLVIKQLGCKVCMVDDDLINPDNEPIECMFKGTLEQLVTFVDQW